MQPIEHRCPICKARTDSASSRDFPFCSERCRFIDLGAWASEKYVVSEPVFDEQELEKLDRQSNRLKAPDDSNETIH